MGFVMIPRELFLEHLTRAGAISYSSDESVVYAPKVFFAYRVAEWTLDSTKSGEIKTSDLNQYWGILNRYLDGEIDLKFHDGMLYYDDPNEEDEGC